MAKNRLQIVGIGGGTGLSVLLVGLKRQLARAGHDPRMRPADLTAIVSVADDGGSTGLLRRSFDIPAVGDLRNCVVALAPGNQMWSRLFQHRFEGENGLSGHALGNQHWPALVKGSRVYVPLTVDRKVMSSVMKTHRFEGVRYEFVPGSEIVPYLAPHESRRLFGGAEGPVHSHTHEHYVAVDDETGETYGRPPVRAHSHAHPHVHSPPHAHRDAGPDDPPRTK